MELEMSYRIKIFLAFVFGILLIVSTESSSQSVSKKDSTKHVMKKMDCCNNKSTTEKSEDCTKGEGTASVSQVNLSEVDKNKDGKVYQCPMCADQVADEPGKCSKCGMNLKEALVEDAKKALNQKTNGMMKVSKMDHSKMMNHADENKMDLKKDTKVREEEIDLNAIDKNKDGKVYIDGMCTDVVKDEPGNCPKCGMKLREVTLKQAIEFIKGN
ncbi:MAG: hypothetical protein C0412_17630 [Flavobacterium sp.]|nr:hypothetical protein [Flavobacterium sp.]